MAKSQSNLYSVILLDIEGTTTPISFVHSTLFPFAQQHLKQHLQQTLDTQQTQDDIDLLRKQAAEDAKNGLVVTQIPTIDYASVSESDRSSLLSAVITNVTEQMSCDRKTAALKSLQGHIWQSGYTSGVLRSCVFDDVAVNLKCWFESGIHCCIYSSGSVEAQKLLFRYTTAGDLTQYLSGHFDITTSGYKQQTSSFVNILNSLNLSSQPHRLLFLTDVYEEANAASEAGCKVCLMLRPENKALPADNSFPTAHSFDEIVTTTAVQHDSVDGLKTCTCVEKAERSPAAV